MRPLSSLAERRVVQHLKTRRTPMTEHEIRHALAPFSRPPVSGKKPHYDPREAVRCSNCDYVFVKSINGKYWTNPRPGVFYSITHLDLCTFCTHQGWGGNGKGWLIWLRPDFHLRARRVRVNFFADARGD